MPPNAAAPSGAAAPPKEEIMNTSNPYHICTQDENSDCGHCALQHRLVCKWDKNIKNSFAAIGFPPILIAIFGMVILGFVSGTWWPLPVYVVYFMSVFGIFEIRFVCSHCPYYADNRKTLRCLGNHGTPKLWRCHPEPMNRLERFLMRFAVVAMIFYILPLSILGYGIGYLAIHYTDFGLLPLLGLTGITFAVFLTSTSFVNVLKTFFCTACVNFSCPLNKVPKTVVDAYLLKNPVMKDAWEKSGYVVEAPIPISSTPDSPKSCAHR
jgi:hypothetical protein